jgi:hypothetical protein
MLTGRTLMRRANHAATLMAVVYGERPAPSSIDPGLSSWDALLETALATDVAARFSTAAEMAEAIGRIDGEAGEVAIARFIEALDGATAGGASSALDTDPTISDRTLPVAR